MAGRTLPSRQGRRGRDRGCRRGCRRAAVPVMSRPGRRHHCIALSSARLREHDAAPRTNHHMRPQPHRCAVPVRRATPGCRALHHRVALRRRREGITAGEHRCKAVRNGGRATSPATAWSCRSMPKSSTSRAPRRVCDGHSMLATNGAVHVPSADRVLRCRTPGAVRVPRCCTKSEVAATAHTLAQLGIAIEGAPPPAFASRAVGSSRTPLRYVDVENAAFGATRRACSCRRRRRAVIEREPCVRRNTLRC